MYCLFSLASSLITSKRLIIASTSISIWLAISSVSASTAYDPASGDELWHARGNTYEAIPTPVVGLGLVFCASGRGGPTLAIRPGGAGDVTNTHIAWKSPKGSPFVPSPLVYREQLYMVNDMTAFRVDWMPFGGKDVSGLGVGGIRYSMHEMTEEKLIVINVRGKR